MDKALWGEMSGYIAFSPYSGKRPAPWLLGGAAARIGLVTSSAAVELQVHLDNKIVVQQRVVQLRPDGTVINNAPILLTPAQTCSCSCLVCNSQHVRTIQQQLSRSKRFTIVRLAQTSHRGDIWRPV